MEQLIFLNLVYFLFGFFLIYPPNEVISLGFSIPKLFSAVLGSEQLHFIHYHMIRILITVSIHSLLPLGYFLFIGTFSEDLNLFDFVKLNVAWRFYFGFSILFATGLLTLVYYWKIDNFNNHPVVVKLQKLPNQRSSSWQVAAGQINTEFRRIEKFIAGNLYNQIFVTETYIIKVGLYTINVSVLNETDFILTHTSEFKLAQDDSLGTQYLNILVKPIQTDEQNTTKPFSIRLNSFEYKEFNDKLQRPVVEASDVIIKQSLPEQFLDAFRYQINENESVRMKREDVDTCIGCMRNLADVDLKKVCDSDDCKTCLCKPMWCLECLGKWFAYRQDQNQPNTWLASKATCATCRAKFCMLDVAPLIIED